MFLEPLSCNFNDTFKGLPWHLKIIFPSTLKCNTFLVIPSLPQFKNQNSLRSKPQNWQKFIRWKKRWFDFVSANSFFIFPYCRKLTNARFRYLFILVIFFWRKYLKTIMIKRCLFPMFFGDKWICLMLSPINFSSFHLLENSLINYG